MLSVAGLAQESGVLAAPKGLFSGTTGDILLVAIFQKKRISLVYLPFESTSLWLVRPHT